MRIFVVGYMGVGKSKQSLILAQSLKVPFIDIDQAIVAEEERSISDIFTWEGESYFRQVEFEVLRRKVNQYDSAVFATGGGLPCQPNVMQILNGLGVTIYLKASYQQILERLSSNRSQRPLVAQKSDRELKAYVANALAEREPMYSKAQICVDLDLTESIETNAKVILKQVQESLHDSTTIASQQPAE